MNTGLMRAVGAAALRNQFEGNALVVFDATPTGIRLAVEPYEQGWHASCADGVSRGVVTWNPTMMGALETALNGYLSILQNGI